MIRAANRIANSGLFFAATLVALLWLFGGFSGIVSAARGHWLHAPTKVSTGPFTDSCTVKVPVQNLSSETIEILGYTAGCACSNLKIPSSIPPFGLAFIEITVAPDSQVDFRVYPERGESIRISIDPPLSHTARVNHSDVDRFGDSILVP